MNVNYQKEGLWVEDNLACLIFGFYKQGKKEGIFRSYDLIDVNNRYLSNITVYKNDKEIGPSQFFEKDGLPSMIVDQISSVIRFKHQANLLGYNINDCNEGYVRIFNKDGSLEREGWMIFFDDMESDEVQEVGTWKIYEKNGHIERKITIQISDD